LPQEVHFSIRIEWVAINGSLQFPIPLRVGRTPILVAPNGAIKDGGCKAARAFVQNFEHFRPESSSLRMSIAHVGENGRRDWNSNTCLWTIIYGHRT